MMIGNIWAVGRNYADHAKELANPIPTEPLIFLKAGSCATFGDEVAWSATCGEIHHEIELALRFGENLEFETMMLALDLTDRPAQNRLKAAGHPWTLAKSFHGACPLSAQTPLPKDPWTANGLGTCLLELKVNGEHRQSATLNDMIFSPSELRKWILGRYPVRPGDLLLTGTPAGVGPLRAGDHLEATLRPAQGTPLLAQSWKVLGGVFPSGK